MLAGPSDVFVHMFKYMGMSIRRVEYVARENLGRDYIVYAETIDGVSVDIRVDIKGDYSGWHTGNVPIET